MIPEFFEELDTSWAFILANALYFKGIWTTKFPESGTKPMPFHSLGGKDVTKDFMNAELPCKLGYSTELSAKMCELTFGNKAFVFDILLPDENVDFDAFVAGLDAERNILIPALQSLGIVSAFNASADFSAMSNIAVFIDSVIQKTRFRMDEDGAEAAAVTVITGRNLASGEPFIADHPFVYAIREISTNTILFLGAYRGLE
jgi:serpin B